MTKIHFTTMFFFLFYILSAQDPGNVSGYTLWLKADTNPSKNSATKKYTPQEIAANHFNFNKVLNPESDLQPLYKNIIVDRYSFFAVFKSDTEQEQAIFTIAKGKSKTLISNKQLVGDSDMAYKKVDSKKGIIISYISAISKKGKKSNSIAIKDFYLGDKEGKQQLMEVLYYPRLLSNLERQRVETYLSLKYGLSIVGDFNYVNSGNDTIWNYKKNKKFSNRVTGIGRDNGLKISQKQSGNAQKDGLYIGFGKIDTTNIKNKYEVKDRVLFLWGDNMGNTEFKKNKKSEDIMVMQRLWKMQCSGIDPTDTITTQLRITKSEMGISIKDAKESFWLAVNDNEGKAFNYSTARYIKQAGEDATYIYFDNVIWDTDNNGSDIFTFIKGPDFFFNDEALTNCKSQQPGSIALAIAGGLPPYQVSLSSGTVNKEQTVAADKFQFTDLPLGNYTVTIKDSKNNTKTTLVKLDDFAQSSISVAPVWYLGRNKNVQVSLTIDEPDSAFTYEWIYNGTVVSTVEYFTATQAGNYTAVVISPQGCKKEMPFTVMPGDTNSGWAVYPNPVKNSQPFNVKFSLDKEARVTLKINSAEGKSFAIKDLGRIKDYTYTDDLPTAGMYLIIATIDNKEEAVKLIIE